MKLLQALSLMIAICSSAWAAVESPPTLEVHTEPSGGVRATATLLIPAPPQVMHQVLTDYEKWPDLFGVPMQVISLERHASGAVTDLLLKHSFLPGGRRLRCDNRELAEGGLVSTLIEGDFKRYVRTWKLAEDGDQGRTRASFDLLVEVETWAPDWLVAFELRRELERHFRLLRERVLARAAAYREVR